MTDIYREMWQIAMAMLADRDKRIQAQAVTIDAKTEEIRRYVASKIGGQDDG